MANDDDEDEPVGRGSPDYLEDDVIDDVLDDALAAQGREPAQRRRDAPETQPADDQPLEQPDVLDQAPARPAAAPPAAEPQLPRHGMEAPGPERWSLLSNFDDMASDPLEAQIEGLDDQQEQTRVTASAPQPDARDTAASGPGLVAKAKRLFAVQDDPREAPARAEPPADDTESDEFWDEVAPPAQGDVDIDAVLARAEQADEPPQPPQPPEPDNAREAEPTPQHAEPPVAPTPTPARPVADDSALGNLMARLRAGPGPRTTTKATINLELDAPTRQVTRESTPQDADLTSVFNRLKTTRRD